MKEITKAKFINTWASEWDERTGWKVSEKYHKQFSEQLEYLINQEVEKRIVERMPSEEEMESEIDRSPADMAFAGGFAECYEWLRSRLVSQKTDNLKENNNNGSTN
jgi:hypothetical protein